MGRFWSQPLLRQLLFAVSLLVVPLTAAMGWTAVTTFRDRVNDLRDEAVVAAATTSQHVNRYLGGLDGMAAALALHPAVQGLDAGAAVELFRRTLPEQPALLNVALVARDYREVARASDPAHALVAGTGWSTLVMNTGARAVTPLETDKAAGVHSIVVGYPVRNESAEVIGALGLRLRLQAIQAEFESLPLPEGSVVTVTDKNGMILARTVAPEAYIGRQTPSVRELEHIPPSEEITGIDGVRRMHGNAFVSRGPWVVSVGIPMDLAFTRASAFWNRSLSLLFVGVLGWAVFAVVISRRFVHSIRLLEAAAERVAAGDLRPLDPVSMPSRELDQLHSAFGLMVQRLNETREALDRQMAEERQIRQKLQSLQGQVIRQERLAAVGLLVSGVAHEINNPLQAILGFAELLQMQHNLPDAVKADLRLIQKESARACGIIRNLALFARQQPGQAAAVRFADVITSVAELRQRRLESEDIELVVDDRSTHHVMAVFTELQQVVLNFVVNAEQAILSSGRLPGRITVRSRDEGDRVLLEVEDTGPGVSPDDEAKLFQPFFTTKPVGQGTGLGLSVSYGIIDSMGGHMGYRRTAAGGAMFHFDLPATQIDSSLR
jgi:C4-dicarboxylate-specific signal transduction histidine kinase